MATTPLSAQADRTQFAPEPLDHICDMEEPLGKVYDLLTSIMYAGSTMNDGGAAIATVAEIARDECEKASKLRDTLFHEMHPNNREVAR